MTSVHEVACAKVGSPEILYPAFLRTYADSEHGRYHAEQPLRYGYFGPETYGRQESLQDLTIDVHPVGHMVATEKTFLEVLSHMKDRLDPEDVDLGRKWSLTHDIGECTHPELEVVVGAVIGDIPQGKKTAEQRAVELRVWDHLIDLYYSGALTEAELRRIRDIVSHSEVSDLAHATEAAHDLNTWRVGLRAGRTALQLLESGQTDGKRYQSLSQLGLVVSREILPKVEEHAVTYELPDRELVKTEPLYRRIQSEL